MKFIRKLCLMLIVMCAVYIEKNVNASEIGLFSGLSTSLEAQMKVNLEKYKHKFNHKFEKTKIKNKKEDVGYNKERKHNFISPDDVDNPDNNIDENKGDLPDIPTYYQGWVKYLNFEITDKMKKTNKHSEFYKNDLFTVQQMKFLGRNGQEKSDEDSTLKIPSELHFYAILYKHSLTLFSSRDDTLQRTVDVLNIDDIKPIPDENNYTGGVRDFGKFDEGFCFRVMTRIPSEPFVMSDSQLEPENGVNKKWVLCLETEKQKTILMNLLIKLKLKKQHLLGVYVDKTNINNNKNSKPVDKIKEKNTVEVTNKIKPDVNASTAAIDGKWVLLQDWSQCTLKCGGGLQYQQMVCVPPKNGGKPCEGPAVRSKPCHTQPCRPIVNVSGINKISSNDNKLTKTLPPIMRMMTLSNRPNRYDKCFIKEDDALIAVKEGDSSEKFATIPKVPAKIILNDKTFSIFKEDDLKNLMISFVTEETVFSRVNDEPSCFILSSLAGSKQAQVCQLDASQKNYWVEEWDYDFNLFKNQCFIPRSKVKPLSFIKDEDKQINKNFEEHLEQIKLDLIKDKAQEVEKDIQEKEEIQMKTRISKVKETSLKAIEKEDKLEQLLEKEEKEIEEKEMSEIKKQIKREEKKEVSLMKAIKEKQLEDQINITKAKAENTIQDITNETKKAIALKREYIKRKIAEMRKRKERRKKELENKLITIRTAVADRLGKATKIGKNENCFTPGDNDEDIAFKYCDDNFSSELEKFSECRKRENFCYICCENEFGDLHLIKRDKCYMKCDKH